MQTNLSILLVIASIAVGGIMTAPTAMSTLAASSNTLVIINCSGGISKTAAAAQHRQAENNVNALTLNCNSGGGGKGEKGDTGARGEKGERGDVGLTGATGAQGEPGKAGAQGERGPPGNNATVVFVYCNTVNDTNPLCKQNPPPSPPPTNTTGNETIKVSDISANTTKNTPLAIELKAESSNKNATSPFTFEAQAAQHGKASVENGTAKATYNPDQNYTGSDAFKYTASSGKIKSNEGKVSINVTEPAPIPPTNTTNTNTTNTNSTPPMVAKSTK
jgi:hypothetical protein